MKKKSKGKKALKIILAVFIIYLLLTVSIFTIVTVYLNKINRAEDVVPVSPEDEFFDVDDGVTSDYGIDPDDIVWNPGCSGRRFAEYSPCRAGQTRG